MQRFAVSVLLLLPVAASAAPVVTASGSCPGATTIELRGIEADGKVALLSAAAEGTFAIPTGGCLGVTTHLDHPSIAYRGTHLADAAGSLDLSVSLPAGACGQLVQAIDLQTCELSNVSGLGLTPIDVDVHDLPGAPEGTLVRVEGLVVTAVSELGLHAQHVDDPDYGGVWVFTGPGWQPYWGDIAVGDRVVVQGEYRDYFGLREIDVLNSVAPSVSVVSSGPAPTPRLVTAADIAADGERYEATLVRLEGATVTVEADEYGEYWIEDASGTLEVDDLVWAPESPLTIGSALSFVQGPLHYSFEAYKIEPRSEADLGL
jgi:hypothetical protein